MNAFAGLLFILAGDGIIVVAVMSGRAGTLGATVTALCGIAAMLIGFYYMLCFLNKSITVSDEGVTYTNWMGRKSRYSWDQVSVSHHPGRNAYFTFDLAGKKVTFYGYAQNAQALYDYLHDNARFDDDTMREARKAAQREAERIREMQQRAREAGAQTDDDDEDWD